MSGAGMNVSRLLTVARREWAAQMQAPPFWVLVVALLLLVASVGPLVMVPTADAVIGGERALENSAHALTASMAVAAFFGYPFFAAFMSGLSVIRDDELGMLELTRSTPLTSAEYHAGKLAGVMAALACAMAIHLLAMLGFREAGAVTAGWHEIARIDMWNYVRPLILIVAPGVWFTATVAFVIGARTRRPMAVYAFAVLLFWVSIRYLWAWSPAWLPPYADQALMVLDPSGLRWLSRTLFADDLGVAYYNSAPVVLDRLFWLGRAVTLSVPLLLLLLHIRGGEVRSNAKSVARSTRRSRKGALGGTAVSRAPRESVASSGFAALAPLQMHNRQPALFNGSAAVFRAELGELIRRPSLWFFALFLCSVVAEVGVAGNDSYGVPVALAAGDFAVRTIPVVTVLVCLFLLFAVVEQMYRDQATQFEPIAHATPVSSAALLTGRAGAMLVVLLGLMAGCAGSVAVMVAISAGAMPATGPLALVYGAVLLPTFLLWTAFVMCVMTTVRHRTAGLGIGLLALLATGGLFLSGELTWASNWPLWAALRWSDMGTFPLNGYALLLNRIAAVTLAAGFAAMALVSFRRIEPDVVARASRRSARQLAVRSMRIVPFALAPVVVTAFLAIEVEQGWQGNAVVAAADEYWTNNAVQWANAPVPTITAVDASLQLEPAAHTLVVNGSYRMRNAADKPMRQLAFTLDDMVGEPGFSVNGDSSAALTNRSGLLVLTPSTPLAPGDTATVAFSYTVQQPRGVSRNGGGRGTFVLPAGVVLSTRRGGFLPVPGFVDRRTPADTAAEDEGERGFNRGHAFTTRLSIRAPDTYTVNSVGEQVAVQSADGFTTVVWQSLEPVHAVNVVAGRWAVRERDGAAVFHHADHDRNVEAMLGTMISARDRYAEWFGEYPWKTLRLSEYPDLETNATAFPTNISFSEGIGFRSSGAAAEGLTFSVVAHEVAHQWWGHLVPAGSGRGTGLLVEGMANFAALRLHAEVRGDTSRQSFARQLEQNYLDVRPERGEPSVLDARERNASEEAVLSYRGALLLWLLREEMGHAAFDAALRFFAVDTRAARALAEPGALLARLRAGAPDSFRFDTFVAQWLAGTVLPEFVVEVRDVTLVDGRFITEADIRNVGTGTVSVDVSAQQSAPVDGAPPTELDRKTVRVSAGGVARVRFSTAARPSRLVVDPRVQLLQRNRDRALAELRAPPQVAAR